MIRRIEAQTLLSALPLVALASTAHSLPPQSHYRYLEAAFAYQSTDWGPYEEEKNLTLLGSAALFKYFHIHARYNNGDTYFPKGVRQKSWLTYGVGAHYYISPRTSVFVGVDQHEMESQSRRPDPEGDEYKIGIRHDLSPNWRLTLEAGEHDLIIENDSTFIAEAIYRPRPDLGLTFRVRDYDELDLSSYELGLRWIY